MNNELYGFWEDGVILPTPQNLAVLMPPSLTYPIWQGEVQQLKGKARETCELASKGERLEGILPGLQYHKDLQLNVHKLDFGRAVPLATQQQKQSFK